MCGLLWMIEFMLLTIDAGNTNIVFAIYDGDALKSQWRLSSSANRTADEYGIWLTRVMELAGLSADDVDAAICASVVPHALFDLKMLCERYFNTKLLVIGESELDLGISIAVDDPQEVGADRLVNSAEAWRKWQKACIIVDFGTATTFDIISPSTTSDQLSTKRGAYIGGVISPGVNLSLDALQQAAAKLPDVSIKQPQKVIGTNTVAAMRSGIYYGYAGLIDGIVENIKKEAELSMHVIATGGLASLYAKATNVIEAVDTELTIRGLMHIYQSNTEI